MVATTALGLLRGRAMEGVHVFRGIRYAQAPTGALRFRAPQPVQPWAGVLDATQFAPAPMQPYDASVGHAPDEMSEDCLALNVWAPPAAGSYPVLVWVHGGGQTIGSTRRLEYNGASFARNGVVCVTVGYRLGVFGFLELGHVVDESYSGSANNALRDLVLALEWVRGHIRAFGGDPSRVTLGGESAGAKNAATLLGVPSARGLFHRLMVASGGVHTFHGVRAAADVAELVRQEAEVPAQEAARLIALPTAALLAAQESAGRRWGAKFPFRPVVDGTFLPAPVLEQFDRGNIVPVPALVGTSQQEAAAFIDLTRSPDSPTSDELAHTTPDRVIALERTYLAMFPNLSSLECRIRVLTAEEYWIPALRLAERIGQHGEPVWMYRFDLGLDGQTDGRPAHVSDLPFWWDQLPPGIASRQAGALELARAMHIALVHFIRGESPVPVGQWPLYEPPVRSTLCWDSATRVLRDPDGLARDLWATTLA